MFSPVDPWMPLSLTLATFFMCLALDSRSSGENTVEWTWVNGGHVSYDREGNWRLSVRKNKGAK